MHSITFVCVLLTLLIVISTAEYYKVKEETCKELQDTTSLFQDFLLPCASYSSDPIELVCLDDTQTAVLVQTVPQWKLNKNSTLGDSLSRTFTFPDFQNAFLFMSGSAQLAEKNQHHPDWRNLYDTVEVTLTTDDKACLSTFDIELAQGMDLLYSNLKR